MGREPTEIHEPEPEPDHTVTGAACAVRDEPPGDPWALTECEDTPRSSIVERYLTPAVLAVVGRIG